MFRGSAGLRYLNGVPRLRVRELRGSGLGVLEVEGSGLSRIATSWPDELP